VSREGRPLWIIGPGRAGLSLALMLHRAGALAGLTLTGRWDDPARLKLLRDRGLRPRFTVRVEEGPGQPPRGVVIAVPDGAIAPIAQQVLKARSLASRTPVLHLSGSAGIEPLAPLADAGHPVGVLHPLCPLPDAVRGSSRLRGAWYGLSGEEGAKEMARWIVRMAGGREIPLREESMGLYHAAASLASNGVVALLSAATRAMTRAGIPDTDARAAVASLAAASAEDVAERGSVEGLTGPVVRGDEETVERHLARLSGPERDLYCLLGREALEIARDRGLDAAVVERLERALADPA